MTPSQVQIVVALCDVFTGAGMASTGPGLLRVLTSPDGFSLGCDQVVSALR